MQPRGWSPLTGKWLRRGAGLLLVAVGGLALVTTPTGIGVFVGDLSILPLMKVAEVLVVLAGLFVVLYR
jgi:hypothetical protein